MNENTAKIQVIEACKELIEKKLVARTWGNVSCRIDNRHFAVTPSGLSYNRLTPENIVVVDINSLKYSGQIEPSSEKGIHASAYRLDKNINFVIHTHQTYATCISVSGFSGLKPTVDEESELGGIGYAKYGLPGSRRLKNNVSKILEQGYKSIILERHGALLTGKNMEEAFKRAVLLENVCKRTVVDLSFSETDFDTIGIRQSHDTFIYHDKDGVRTVRMSANNIPKTMNIHRTILTELPDIKVVLSRSTEAALKAAETLDSLPAVIDDFAQMVGIDALTVSPDDINALKKAIKDRNGVFIKSIGAVGYAEEESDAKALLTLMEKNALAYLNAKTRGTISPLSLLDRKLMRNNYIKKYSKKK